MNSEVTSDPAIPAHIREAMSPQMREVLAVQATRAADCRLAADKTLAEAAVAEAALAQTPSTEPNGNSSTPREVAWARAEYRAERSYWNQGGPTMADTVDTTIRATDVEVPVRIHRPTTEARLPGIVFIHGGGYCLGDLDSHERIARVIAAGSGAAVIAVDYSLSPEAVFPQALEECAGVIAHLARRGGDLGIDGTRLAVAGDSAGAQLSLGSALLLRDDPASVGAASASFASIGALLLFYGSHGLRDSASRRLFGGAWDGLGPEALAQISSLYFRSPADAVSPFVNHLGADLTGLPPIFIAAAGLDPLRDDSRALAELLRRADNDTDFVEYPHVLHSFLHFGRMLDEAADALARAAAFGARRLTSRAPA